MSERIQNGNFSSGFDYWLNGSPPFAYTWDSGKAMATSPGGTTAGKYFHIKQSFAVNYEVISADIDAWYQWSCPECSPPWHDEDGSAEFWVILIKPNLDEIELAHIAKSGITSGSGWLLQNEDIKSHFDQQGNYKIYLKCRVASAKGHDAFGDPVYCRSYGWYDNISIDIKIKKTKVVFEAVGATDEPQGLVKKTVKENTGASESYSTTFIKSKLVSEAAGAVEGFSMLIKKTVKEIVGALENYFVSNFSKTVKEDVGATESYSTIMIKRKTLKEQVGVDEKLTALKTSGNLEVYIDIKPPAEWDEVAKSTTQWVKEKKVIN